MEYRLQQQTPGQVLCCLCGTPIVSNPANMCVQCIRTQVDITEGINKQAVVLNCQECNRWHTPPKAWLKAEPESKELLTLCLKKLKNLNKVKLVDAGFIWTEPHSKRLKVKVTIQKEIFNGAIVQQAFVVEYVVQNNLCDICQKAAANSDQWVAAVQVRQKVEHKRTFLFLEQIILKHAADAFTVNIKEMHDGVDFFYANRSHAMKFVEFLNAVVPVKSRHDKQLISHDSHSNTYNYKYTFSVEIVPVCKDDLVCLSARVSAALGNIGQLLLVTRVSNALLVLNPRTLRTAYVDATTYWRYPFRPLMTSRQLIEYVVLDIEPMDTVVTAGSMKYALAEATVARASDFGVNDTQFIARTHLGHLLKPGDLAMGYDVAGINSNDEEFEKVLAKSAGDLPDVVLVKKSYEESRKKNRGRRRRAWRLKRLNAEQADVPMKGEADKDQNDYEKFLEELEEDPDMRSRIALYKDPEAVAAAQQQQQKQPQQQPPPQADEGDAEPLPEVPLEELLDAMTLAEDGEDDDDDVESMDT
eukprot:jgi/Chlat1/760/Chrsp104S00026